MEQVYLEFGCRANSNKVLRNIKTGEVRAYDLQNDPGELCSLSSHTNNSASALQALDQEITHAKVGSHSEEDYLRMRRQLENLGYL